MIFYTWEIAIVLTDTESLRLADERNAPCSALRDSGKWSHDLIIINHLVGKSSVKLFSISVAGVVMKCFVVSL
jgi:hypothetical protein